MSDTLIADRYRLVRALGRGAVGEVWLADDLVLSRQVAIKRLSANPAAGFDSDAIERVVREARVAARLHHPNVVSVFDLVTDHGQPYVVMEYVDGETLEARLRRSGPLPADDARRVIGEVAEALAAAHSRGIVHRDVKPANIMIDGSGRAKLADFGIARGEGDSVLTMTGQTVGTIAYMAPEVARGEPAVAASDVWSLGVTLFAATQGHSPYDDGRSQSAIGMLMRIASEPLPEIPIGPLSSVIARMLTPDPKARPAAREVARELAAGAPPAASLPGAASSAVDTVLRNGPDARSVEITVDRPVASRTSHRSTARRSRRRLALLIAGVGAVLIAAAALITVNLVSGRSPGSSVPIYSARALAQTGDGASGASSPDGRDEYLIAGSSLAVLDPSTGHFIRSIPLDPSTNATQVIVTKTGDTAYVTEVPATVDPFNERGGTLGTLLQVRLATKQIVNRLQLCGNPTPRGMVISPDGRQLLLATDSCNELIDAQTLTVVHSRPSPGAGSAPPPTITPDGLTGWVAEASGLLVRIDMATGEFKGVTDAIKGVRGLLASADGKYLYAYSSNGLFGTASLPGELAPIDVKAPKPALSHGALTLGFGAYTAAVSPGGRYVVAVSSGYNSATHTQQPGVLTIIDTTQDFLDFPVPIAPGRGTIAFSADGQAVFVASVDGTISKVDLATHTIVHTIKGGGAWLFRSSDPLVLYASDGRASGIAIDASTGALLRPVSLSG